MAGKLVSNDRNYVHHKGRRQSHSKDRHTKRHQNIVISRCHTMSTRTRQQLAGQRDNPNMTKSDKMQTPPRGRGTNNATPAEESTTVTPQIARNTGATNITSEEAGSTNGEAQTTMDVEVMARNTQGRAVDEDNLVKVAAARTAEALQKIKEKRSVLLGQQLG